MAGLSLPLLVYAYPACGGVVALFIALVCIARTMAVAIRDHAEAPVRAGKIVCLLLAPAQSNDPDIQDYAGHIAPEGNVARTLSQPIRITAPARAHALN